MMSDFYIFFSSRRRHTRYWRDWSSDVCSSDLNPAPTILYLAMNHERRLFGGGGNGNVRLKRGVNYAIDRQAMLTQRGADRKRRRVGKECRSRWSPYH